MLAAPSFVKTIENVQCMQNRKFSCKKFRISTAAQMKMVNMSPAPGLEAPQSLFGARESDWEARSSANVTAITAMLKLSVYSLPHLFSVRLHREPPDLKVMRDQSLITAEN